jgi:Phosphatidylserine/phosphatidylglycerophosphate/cardiolipin synthases and related enzymes
MQKMFEHDLQHSRQITLEQWRKRSLNARLKEKAARLWARWL